MTTAEKLLERQEHQKDFFAKVTQPQDMEVEESTLFPRSTRKGEMSE
jgi:hypothetical protein